LRTASAPIADADRAGTDRLRDAEVDQLKRDVSRAPPGWSFAARFTTVEREPTPLFDAPNPPIVIDSVVRSH